MNTMITYTPGPWHVDDESMTATVRDSKGKAVARCYQGDDDARAIARLPDILESIQRELNAPYRIVGTERPWLMANGKFCAYVDAIPDVIECLRLLHEVASDLGGESEWMDGRIYRAKYALKRALSNP
jgi:hypothetical protein